MCDERARVVMDVLFHLFSPIHSCYHLEKNDGSEPNHMSNLYPYARFLSPKGLVRSSSACANGSVKTCQGQCWVHFQNVERCWLYTTNIFVNSPVAAPYGWPRGELCAGRRFPPPLPVFHELQRTRMKNGHTLQPWQTSKK